MSSNQFFGSDFSNNPFVAAQPAIATKPIVIEGVEIESKSALEIEVRWGDQVLHVMHLSPARDVFVGDDAEGPVDYKLPTARVQVVRASGESVVALNDAGDVALARGQKNERRIGDFTIHTAVVAAGKAPPRDSSKARRKVMGFWAASAALHLALIAGFMFAPGASLDDEAAGLDKSTQAYLMQMQSARADREIKQEESDGEKSDSTNGSAGGAHAGASGQMGKPDKSMTGGHYQVKGPPETTEMKLAKTHAMIERSARSLRCSARRATRRSLSTAATRASARIPPTTRAICSAIIPATRLATTVSDRWAPDRAVMVCSMASVSTASATSVMAASAATAAPAESGAPGPGARDSSAPRRP